MEGDWRVDEMDTVHTRKVPCPAHTLHAGETARGSRKAAEKAEGPIAEQR